MESARSVENRISAHDARTFLYKVFPQGAKVYTMHVDMNQSGVHHTIVILGILDGEIFNVSAMVARLMENPYDNNRHGVRMQGGGLDLGHHASDWLSRTLHGSGNRLLHVGL